MYNSRIKTLVHHHDRYRRSVLNLQASENFMIPDARKVLSSDLASRYSHIDDAGINSYGGSSFAEEILLETENLTNKVFNSRYCDVRPVGGHIAALSALLSFVSKGDTIMSIPSSKGGYPGYDQDYLPSMMSVRSVHIPYDYEKQVIDYDEMEMVARKERVRCIVLGQSAFLKSYDLRRIKEIASSMPTDAKIIYDGSHVMGLIAGGVFQTDALKYSDVIVGSTHKSFYGPQGGLILSNDPSIMETVRKNITWKTMDNYHPNRIAALGITMEDFLTSGKKYASLVVKNSRELGQSLHERGVDVRFAPWFSETHQILISHDYLRENGLDFVSFSRLMESNGIIVDRDGRIGTSEISHHGYSDMKIISELMERALKRENVKARVKDVAHGILNGAVTK